MSVATPAPSRLKSWHRLSLRPSQIYFWGVSLLWLAILGWNFATEGPPTSSSALALIPWIVALAVVNMLPVRIWPHADFTPDVPIYVAGALLLSPLEIGLASFIGCFDQREFKGQITLGKAIFNRSQAGLAASCASLVAHYGVNLPGSSALVLLLALLVLSTSLLVNYTLVGFGISLEYEWSPRTALRRMRVGTPWDFLFTLISWAVLGAMLAVFYEQVGSVALVAFLAPTLLGRQALARSQMFLEATRAYRSREAALTEIGNRIHQERQDERKLIAASLHDEVLQPLFKVSLMANVVRTDLATGRLLEADEDLPELLSAAEVASNALREVVGDLRRSAIGRGGLGPSLLSLARGLQDTTSITFHADISPIRTASEDELVLYQVAKEALTNAAAHSRADNVWLELRQDRDCVSVKVRDDGRGFDSLAVRDDHFGLAIMRERALSVGGQLFIDSLPGRGSEISLIVPSDPSE